MIGFLKGIILEKLAPYVLLDVHGVGYEVQLSMTSFCQLPETGSPAELHTHLQVRDDAHLLFGFTSKSERDTFRALLRTNGVGAKLALTILSGMSVPDLHRNVMSNDKTSFTRLPGIGSKTAERLLIEMRDRLPQVQLTMANAQDPSASQKQEAVSAMVALGYKPADALRWIDQVFDATLTSELLIRRALQATIQQK